MVSNNPLNKYFRQPKMFISLPSKGMYYPPGVLDGDYNNVPIFGMTGMDEILMRTPDALFNGESSIKVIESCCPYIKNAKLIPAIDVDALLIAIRIATYGEKMSISSTCKKCQDENNYDIELNSLLEYFSTPIFNDTIQISNEIYIKVKPLSYSELINFSIENFKVQRTLTQLSTLNDDERTQFINEVYQNLGKIQVSVFMTCIDKVITPEEEVTDKLLISEWLQNSDKEIYTKIKDHIENNKKIWDIPEQHVHCPACGEDNILSVVIDQSSFFG